MFGADIYLKPLHISIVDIYKVYQSLVCCLKGMRVHPFTVTPANFALDLGFRLTCGVKMMPLCHGSALGPLINLETQHDGRSARS